MVCVFSLVGGPLEVQFYYLETGRYIFLSLFRTWFRISENFFRHVRKEFDVFKISEIIKKEKLEIKNISRD